MKTQNKRRIPSFTATVDVDVDIDPEDLHDHGWHHETECGLDAAPENDEPSPLFASDVHALGRAIASLHRQAHPSALPSVRLCHEEPCRSLTLDQLGVVSGG